MPPSRPADRRREHHPERQRPPSRELATRSSISSLAAAETAKRQCLDQRVTPPLPSESPLVGRHFPECERSGTRFPLGGKQMTSTPGSLTNKRRTVSSLTFSCSPTSKEREQVVTDIDLGWSCGDRLLVRLRHSHARPRRESAQSATFARRYVACRIIRFGVGAYPRLREEP